MADGQFGQKSFSFFQLCDDSLQSGWNPEYTEEIAFLEVIDWCPVWNAAVGFYFIDLARAPVVFYTTALSVF